MTIRNLQKKNWKWVNHQSVFYAHDELISEHGGGHGIRDLGLIVSALNRPNHMVNYGNPDAADLAAAYAHGIVKNHGFMDGNKRTSFATAVLFLRMNGYSLPIKTNQAFKMLTEIANNTKTQQDLANWFRQNIR